MAGRFALEEDDLVPPLAQGDEQGEERRADEEPVGERDADDQPAGDDPKDEARRDEKDVEDDDVLELERVGRLEKGVSGRGEEERQAQEEGRGEAAQPEDRGRGQARPSGQAARGDGAFRFLGMDAVLGVVAAIVQEIDRSREKTEDAEGRDRPQEQGDVEDFKGEDEGGEDKGVLRPLSRPEGAENGAEHR